ncbi:thiaminase II [Oceanimonas sp. NS1]|nr:thiaminase II [Oceanimonas sp. NS1]
MQFGRAFALAAYKSPTLADLRHAKAGLDAIIDLELGLHIDYCTQWGISEQELAELPEARATLAYTRYVLDTGNRGICWICTWPWRPAWWAMPTSPAGWWSSPPPCAVRRTPMSPGLPCMKAPSFQAAAQAEIAWLNQRLAEVSPSRFRQLCRIFDDATRLEIDFWDMGLEQRM